MNSKLLVIGGGFENDKMYSDIDENFVTIGYHKGPMKNIDWSNPNYWNETIFILEKIIGKVCCIIIDQGSESWLKKTDIDEVINFILIMLKEDGIFVCAPWIIIPPGTNLTLDLDKIENKILTDLKKINFELNNIFYVGNPKDSYFEINDLLAIYTRKSKNIEKDGEYDDLYGIFYYFNEEYLMEILKNNNNRNIIRKTGQSYQTKFKLLLKLWC